MAKVMLVEDDNNLREIYEARLAAEGYEIVSAHDGEEALALAVKEQPNLIISDIMMPKISGFDMLDILRSTPETKDTKIVMMTALSQAEDKERAGKLGADKYLVKSQVTLEDVVRVAKELLEQPAAGAPADTSTVPVTPAPAGDAVTAAPAPAPQPSAPPTNVPVATPPADASAIPAPAAPAADTPAPVAPAPAPAPQPASPVATTPATNDVPDTGSTNDPEPAAAAEPSAETLSSVEDQIRDFISTAEQVKNNAAAPTAPAANTPASAPSAPQPTSIPVTTTPPEAPTQPQLATPSSQKKVIEPLNDLSKPGIDLDALLALEEGGGPEAPTTPVPSINTVISPDGTLTYASPPPEDAAPTTASTNESSSTPETADPQPGQKIDPNSISL